MKRSIFFIFIILFSFLLIRSFNSKPELDNTESLAQLPQDKPKTNQRAQYLFNQKMKLIAEKDFQEYLRLKDQEEIFYKSEEILNKIMLLFLAQIGMRLPQQDQARVEAIAETPYIERMKRGPEVVINPYKDLYIENTKEPIECPKVECKKVDLKPEKSPFKKDWLKFSQNQLGSVKPRVDHDIFKDFWQKSIPYSGEVKPLLLDHITYYEGDFEGIMKFNDNSEYKTILKFNISNNSSDRNVNVLISLWSREGHFHLRNVKFKAVHPVTHSDSGAGNCRGVILKGKDLEIHFSLLKKSDNEFLAKVIDLKFNTKQKLSFVGALHLRKKTKILNRVESRLR